MENLRETSHLLLTVEIPRNFTDSRGEERTQVYVKLVFYLSKVNP